MCDIVLLLQLVINMLPYTWKLFFNRKEFDCNQVAVFVILKVILSSIQFIMYKYWHRWKLSKEWKSPTYIRWLQYYD